MQCIRLMGVSLMLVLLCNVPRGIAQGVMARLEEYGVESTVFDFPCVLHFDILVTTERLVPGVTTQNRLIGRHIHVSEQRFRNDYIELETTAAGEIRDRENLVLHLSNSQQFTGGSFGGGFQGFIEVTEPDVGFRDLVFCNPFWYAIKGVQEMDRNRHVDNAKVFTSSRVAIGTSERYTKSKRNTVVHEYTFDENDPWRIVRTRVLMPGGNPAAAMSYKKEINSPEDFKDFSPVVETHVKWRELDGKIKVPFWIHYRDENLNLTEPGFINEMEAFFFGFDLNPKDLDRYFDTKRLNEKDWQEDFNFKGIQVFADKERQIHLPK